MLSAKTFWKARSGIYYDARKKATDFEIITGGKTIKAGAEHEQDKNKSESPGKSDVKRRDNSKFVPGNNDYFSDNKNNNSDNKNKDKDNKNNNRNDNKNKDNKTNDSDKNNNNKDKNYNDRSIKDIKNNDKRDESWVNDPNNCESAVDITTFFAAGTGVVQTTGLYDNTAATAR